MTKAPPKLESLLDDDMRASPPEKPQRAGRDRERLRSAAFIGGSVLALVFATFMMANSIGFGSVSPGDASRLRTLIDSETGEVFHSYKISDGTRSPWRNPRTGQNTLYPAETCYWNADGTAKLEPTWVFVRAYLGETTETRCPDCGRRVVPHNPLPPDDLLLEAAERAKAGGK